MNKVKGNKIEGAENTWDDMTQRVATVLKYIHETDSSYAIVFINRKPQIYVHTMEITKSMEDECMADVEIID